MNLWKQDDEPTDKKALENLELAQKVYATEVQIDLANQAQWVRSGHLLEGGTFTPKIPKQRYFKETKKKNHVHQFNRQGFKANGLRFWACPCGFEQYPDGKGKWS